MDSILIVVWWIKFLSFIAVLCLHCYFAKGCKKLVVHWTILLCMQERWWTLNVAFYVVLEWCVWVSKSDACTLDYAHVKSPKAVWNWRKLVEIFPASLAKLVSIMIIISCVTVAEQEHITN